jgi:N utilization substance protein A
MKNKILEMADILAHEKSIELSSIFNAMEEAFSKIGRSKYGAHLDIRAHVDQKKGDIYWAHHRTVVEGVPETDSELSLEDALKEDASAVIGTVFQDALPPVELNRSSAQTVRQIILQKIREAERKRQYDSFKDKKDQVVSGSVKRVEADGNIVIDFGRVEAILPRRELIPRELIRQGDRIRCYVYEVKEAPRGPQIFLSRTHPQFLAKLFHQEVPEVYDGVIEIKSVARDCGSRAKMAVYSEDRSIDAVGSCVGMRGSRIQAVIEELYGEKIDVIPYSADVATFVVNALAPAEVSKVVLDEDSRRVFVVVEEDQLSLAIGRRGQNVSLASTLCGLDIDVITVAQDTEKRQQEFAKITQLYQETLDVDEVIAQLLATEGFVTVEDIVEADVEEISEIEGFNPDIASEIYNRAVVYLTEKDAAIMAEYKALGAQEDLITFNSLGHKNKLIIAKTGVKSLDDLADLSSVELKEILGDKFSVKRAGDIIMDARAHWFEDKNTNENTDETNDTAEDVAETQNDAAENTADTPEATTAENASDHSINTTETTNDSDTDS